MGYAAGMNTPGFAIIGLPAGFLLGTLGEYWIHRFMHRGWVLARAHGEHHREGWGQGVLKEFRDYSIGTLAALALLLPADIYFGSGGTVVGFVLAGGLAHAIFAAWCHQAQHEDPRLLPWMARTPVHFVHHARAQARHNFGISVDWWDHLFGTYREEPEWRTLLDPSAPHRKPWQLDWRPPANPQPIQLRRKG